MRNEISQERIDIQMKLERDAIKCGLERLHRNTYNVEQKDYASSSIYGVASIDTLLPLVEAEIKDTVEYQVKRGKNGVAFKEIATYLSDIEADACAAITCKMVFDKVFSFREDSSKHVNICMTIGQAVEQECQMRFYEREAPGLLQFLKKEYWHKASGTQQKFVNIRRSMNAKGIKWDTWDNPTRVKLGNWLLGCVMKASSWFETQLVRIGRKTETHVVPTAEFMDIKDEVMANAELFSSLAWPMLIPPNEWSPEEQGGYLLNDVMRGHDMVRRGRPLIQEESVYAFLNRVQAVAYKLNPFIVDVAEVLLEKGVKVGKFIPIVDIPLPPKPADIAENRDSRHEYRKAAAEVRNKNAASFKESCRTRMTMETVKRFKDKEEFWLPWSYDYRGRAYPIPAFLTPQDTDFGKSLLVFAEGGYLLPEHEEWLAFQVATTYGLDKSTIEERLEWTRANVDLIKKVASDPLGTIPEWEAADEPWQFLAACEEYYHCCVLCDRQFTHLPVATDATCSGLQILAGLAKDKSTAKLVNVTPSERPQDAYKVVAQTALPNCPPSIQPHMDRKVTKRTVMTVPYNAKPFSNRGYIREALREKGVEISKEDLTATVKAVRDAMYQVVPGPMAVMDWIEAQVREALKQGKEELSWVTPSGFTVVQRLMKHKKDVLKLALLGKIQKVTVATGETDEIDVRHHCNATAPNLIHSLDASLLHLSALKFNGPLALIHDSVLCRATDMTSLSAIVRETYCHLFADHDYLSDWAEQIGATTPPPLVNDLKPENVLVSTYFFC